MKNIKLSLLLFVLLLSAISKDAWGTYLTDNNSGIPIKESTIHNEPKTSSIQASIDGHMLTVIFLENLGSVLVEVTDANGGTVDVVDMYTPNGYTAYILGTGSYVVTITLPNGDEYYGEFEVTEWYNIVFF